MTVLPGRQSTCDPTTKRYGAHSISVLNLVNVADGSEQVNGPNAIADARSGKNGD
jgi:hypothetical protein